MIGDIRRRAARAARTLWTGGLKRAVDFGLTSAACVAAAPVLTFAAVTVKLTSPGPVLFTQVRIGRSGRPFVLYKLRTMHVSHEHKPDEVITQAHQGVTKVGRLLRRTKVDELPQLFNVLIGDMALVGPRPTVPEQVERYDPFERQRLLVRPGLTGLAQVNGNAALPWPERIRYDVHYARHHDFCMDARIMLRTVLIVALGEARFACTFDQSGYATGGVEA